MFARIVSLALVMSACLPVARAQQPLNLDFENRGDDPSLPENWFIGGNGYEVKLDAKDRKSGDVSLRMTRTANQGGFAVATSSLPVALAKGKTIRLGGAIKTDEVNQGHASLWLRVDGPNGSMLGFDNMTTKVGPDGDEDKTDRAVRGSSPWKRYEIEVKVDPKATNINFGCMLAGDGTARFDALTVTIDGKPYDELREEAKTALALKPEQVDWLKKQAIPFETAEAGHGFADLQPLKAAIGDAHIVSLGEATHGTAEFFQMKHRLTEFLASEMGFTAFAIEASMPEAFRLNDFVLHGKGDPKELLRGMYFWTWNTEEVLAMILWMREFNQSGKGRMEFLGFDMQEPKVASENVRAFVTKLDPEYAKTLDVAYEGLKSFRQLQMDLQNGTGLPDENGAVDRKAGRARAGVQKLADAAEEVFKHLEGRRAELIKAAQGDEAAVDWGIQNARIVVQAVTVAIGRYDYRDRSMADNVDWILKHRPAGTKVVLWAHNGHVAKRQGAMGGFLDERHGKDMVVAGFAFHEGRYTAIAPGQGLQANEAASSEPGSVEWAFHQAGLPRAIVDLRKVEKGSGGSGWLAEPIPHRNIGALAMKSAFFPANLPASYDLLLFFDKTKASVLLPPHRRE